MQSLRAVLIEQLFFQMSLYFFQEKQETQEKQEIFPNFGSLTEGEYLECLVFQYFGGGKKGKSGSINIARKKNGNLGQKVPR